MRYILSRTLTTSISATVSLGLFDSSFGDVENDDYGYDDAWDDDYDIDSDIKFLTLGIQEYLPFTFSQTPMK